MINPAVTEQYRRLIKPILLLWKDHMCGDVVEGRAELTFGISFLELLGDVIIELGSHGVKPETRFLIEIALAIAFGVPETRRHDSRSLLAEKGLKVESCEHGKNYLRLVLSTDRPIDLGLLRCE